MSNPFRNLPPTITGPATGAFAITPNDSTVFANVIRGVTIGTAAGTISYVYQGVIYTTGQLPIGRHDFLAETIRATGTTATGLTGWN